MHGKKAMVEQKNAQVWEQFAASQGLDDIQLGQFKRYAELLISWNELFNLTAVIGTEKIITRHFEDSMHLGQIIDMDKVSMIADVGSGAGFPGIPLKIKYPHLTVALIEVTHKKAEFLNHVIDELKLEATDVAPLDWRTFIRTTRYPVDLFVARASLQPEELMRMFKPGCGYNMAKLVYWASKDWQPTEEEAPFIKEDKAYQVGDKKRRYIIFAKP
jgi:16S rRNA (guanine527-N7)-methyltransferase